MKRLFVILLFCILVPSAYGETITHFDGGEYVGEVSSIGLKHGLGTYTYADGSKYVGEWKDDDYHGHGTYTFADGSKYVGDWKNGIRWTGTQYGVDGSIEAIFTQGIWEAKSSCVDRRKFVQNGKNMIDCAYAEGDRYIGTSTDEAMWDGYGIYLWPNGDKYIGGYKDGEHHGDGAHFWSSGEMQSGQFKNGRLNGYGVNRWPDGEIQSGQYKDDKLNGHGTSIWPNGDKYVGLYQNGLKHGHGIFVFSDGRMYMGDFLKDLRWNGIGYNADGSVAGTYSNGKWIPN